MKHYKLLAWPDLPVSYHRTAYRRMLSDMSHRDMSVAQLSASSGLHRNEVNTFLDMLLSRNALRERETGSPDSIYDTLAPIGGWIRKAFTADLTSRATWR